MFCGVLGRITITRVYTFLAAFLVLVLFIQGIASASVPVQITNDPYSQGRPDVRDDLIVWKDFRSGTNYDIYAYDIPSTTEYPISTNSAYQNLPVTNGSVILWQDNRNGSWDIYMKDTVFGFEVPLVTDPWNQGISDIDGDTLVYIDDSSGNNDVYTLDLGTMVTQPVCTNPSDQWRPRISGTKVVWQDNRQNSNGDIYMKDLAGGPEVPITSDTDIDDNADISGDIVVWRSRRGGQFDIRAYNLSDETVNNLAPGIETAITNDAAYQSSPRISGDLIAWDDFRNDPIPGDTYYDYDVYMKDLTSGVESGLATGPSIQAEVAIDKETVVWADTVAGNYDVWMTYVPDETAPVISGETPEADTVTGCQSPLISAAVSDNRTGVDTASITVSFDGDDVTAESTITADSVSYLPDALDEGLHSVSIGAADNAGNSSTYDWEFTYEQIDLRLSILDSYWASSADYNNGILTVGFSINNDSEYATAEETQILDASAGAGVVPWTTFAVPIGSIAPSGHSDFELKYLLPEGTDFFTTTIYASCEDECEALYYFPGPPPS